MLTYSFTHTRILSFPQGGWRGVALNVGSSLREQGRTLVDVGRALWWGLTSFAQLCRIVANAAAAAARHAAPK